MQRVAETISAITGWRRCAAAFLLGALSTLAFAPVHFWPAMFATIPGFVWLLDGCFSRNSKNGSGARKRYVSAAWTGWWFGFGFFLFGLYWIGFAFLVEAEIFAFLLPFAVTLMPAGLALFFAMAAAAAGFLWRPGLARIVGLALTVTVAEVLRGKVLTGFPWNTVGYALTGSEAMMQSASIVGVYSLTLFAMLVFAVPALGWAGGAMAETSKSRKYAFPAIMAALLVASTAWGHLRVENAPLKFLDGARLRIVQPNIPQKDKWKPENRGAVFQRYLQVSRDKTLLGDLGDVTHLIWPESAVPFLLADTPEALNAISDLLPPGATFITGAARGERRETSDGGLSVYNSLFVMNDQAQILNVYDKVHLVPFGEYLPFQETLESFGLSQLTRIRGGFTAGAGTRLLEVPGLPDFVALICYEIIFPEQIRESGTKPGWLLNVTNDAWFGNSAGPHQHFHLARVRAVEQGLPLVRAANNGISAVLDPYGRIVARLPRNTARAMDSALPASLPGTVFSRWGGLILPASLFAALLLWLAVGRTMPVRNS